MGVRWSHLPSGERKVLELAVGKGGRRPMTDIEIADTYDVSVSRIRALKRQGLRRLDPVVLAWVRGRLTS